MSAIFGFTFHIGRMTEVLTPDIYIELTETDKSVCLIHRNIRGLIFLWSQWSVCLS